MNKILNLTIVSVLSMVSFACSKNVKLRFDQPDDEIAMVCEHGKLGRVNVTCGSYDQIHAAKGQFSKPGLVVVVEVGTFAANRGLGSENPFSAMLRSGELASYTNLQAHIRLMLHNLFIAFLEKTLDNTERKYDQVYIAHLPNEAGKDLKHKFMSALSAATKNHSKVDLMFVGHAVAGEILMTSKLEKNNSKVNLTAQQLVDLTAKYLTLAERNKVRAIFQTYCYVAKKSKSVAAGKTASIFEAYGKSFPKAEFYGSVGVNTFPLHRDFVMFEKFYKTQDYKLAHRTAVRTMTTTPHDREERTKITFPSLRIKGCVDLFFGNKCENRTISTGVVGNKGSIQKLIQSSMPIYGNAAIAAEL